MNRVKVLPDQTIYDIAVQEYGTVAGVFVLIEDNGGVDLKTDLVPGQELQIRPEKLDKEMVSYLLANNVKPANAGGDDPLQGAFSDGFSDGFNTGD